MIARRGLIAILILAALQLPAPASADEPVATPNPASPATPVRADASDDAVEDYFRAQESSFERRDLDAFLRGYAPSFQSNFGESNRARIEKSVRDIFENAFAAYRTTILSHRAEDGFYTATVVSETRFGKGDEGAYCVKDTAVWVLEPAGGSPERLHVTNRFSVDPEAQTRFRGGRYSSPQAGYSFECPRGWALFVPLRAASPTFDVVWLYRPSTRSIAGIAVVDLPPRPVSARRMAEIELASHLGSTQRETRVLASEAAEVDSLSSWRNDYVSSQGPLALHVRKYHVVRERLYSTVYFQARTEDAYKNDLASFEQLRETLRFEKPGVPRKGAVQDGRFVHENPSCEVRAPEGWSIATGASRDVFRVFLVPPTRSAPEDDDSRVVFFARRYPGIGGDSGALERYLQKIVAKLQKDVPNAVLLSEIEVVRAGSIEGRGVTMTLPTDGIKRVRKIAVFGRGEHLFVFHCDAIPPQRFAKLEADFDRIVASLVLR